MLNTFFTVSPLSGDVIATKFTTTNYTSGASVAKYVWDPGIRDISRDELGTANLAKSKLIYNESSPTFTYKLPGVYTITLTATDFDNNQSVFSQTITADFAYRDYLKFSQIPDKYADPGKLTEIPFRLDILTTQINTPLVIDLFATNSKSTPYQFVPNKWSFLTPTWRFLDKNLTPVTSLSVISTPIYKNNEVVAVSGSVEFYFVDSMSSGDPRKDCPILITATVQTSGFNNPEDSNIYQYNSYANNLTLQTGLIWQVNDLVPNVLKVTGNYLDNINYKQWKDIKIPFLITCHSNRSLFLSGSDDSLSEVLFSYPINNEIGKQSPVNISFNKLSPGDIVIDDAPLFFQQTDKDEYRSGGYIFTTATSKTIVDETAINVQATVFNPTNAQLNEKFVYPGSYSPNSNVWVSNPNQGTLNKITLVPDPGNCNTINFLRNVGTLVDGTIKEISVPIKQDISTVNYDLSGFSGIYGIAIDPRDYSIVAADTELDRLYRFANDGTLLKTFELSSLNDYDPQKKMFGSWSWTTPSPLAKAAKYVLYSTNLISRNNANYIALVGGVIQPNDVIAIDPSEKFDIEVFSVTQNKNIEYELRLDPFKQIFQLKSGSEYPPENIHVDLIQIFNPVLDNYISNLQYWTLTAAQPNTVFPLTNAPSLSTNSNYYIVSIDGVLQNPNTYSISNINKTISFTTPVPENLTLHILYIPGILPPASWNYTLSSSTNILPLTGNNRYIRDNQSAFIVNVGGVLQPPTTFKHVISPPQIEFNTTLPTNTPINIRQITVPENVYVPAAYTPAYVSLDKKYNIWVSLFNSVSVLKFDSDFNFLFSVAPTGIGWAPQLQTVLPEGIDYQTSLFTNLVSTTKLSSVGVENYYNEFFLKPPVVETDKDNNCWVTYANPLCGMLVKYSENGQSLIQVNPQAYNSMPMNIVIDSNNNCWVSNFHGSSYISTPLSGSLNLYDTNNGNLLSSIRGISRPGHIALDRSNNLWFTHSINRIGYLDTTTSVISTWSLSSNGFSVYTIPSSFESTDFFDFDTEENREDDYFGGLAVDVYDRVWVIDNLQNFVWVISATPNFDNAPQRKFKIRPIPALGYYPDLDTGETFTEAKEDYYYRSAQATGDWTGNRWYQKYTDPNLLTTISLTGRSNIFNIVEFQNNNQIRRINESFDMKNYYKSLALPEILNSNTKLFDDFFGAAVGNSSDSTYEDLGQTIYERTANFTLNHADIETCNIKQLLSLAELVNAPAVDYAATYPTEISNMLDIASIPKSKLWGVKDEVPILRNSIGDKYNTQTDTVTAGTKIILLSKLDSTYSLIQVPPLSTTTIYPIQNLKVPGFVEPLLTNYNLYRFTLKNTNEYIENIIDWNSPFTTHSPYISSMIEWYGDDGALETAFRYLLTKNLFLK